MVASQAEPAGNVPNDPLTPPLLVCKVPHDAEAVTKTAPAGRGFVQLTDTAALGPAFETMIDCVRLLPIQYGPGPTLEISRMSAAGFVGTSEVRSTNKCPTSVRKAKPSAPQRTRLDGVP